MFLKNYILCRISGRFILIILGNCEQLICKACLLNVQKRQILSVFTVHSALQKSEIFVDVFKQLGWTIFRLKLQPIVCNKTSSLFSYSETPIH